MRSFFCMRYRKLFDRKISDMSEAFYQVFTTIFSHLRTVGRGTKLSKGTKEEFVHGLRSFGRSQIFTVSPLIFFLIGCILFK